MVQVEFRERTSILPSRSASNRVSADSGTSWTLAGSANIAAARARQKSTSNPDHAPRSSTNENPGSPSLTPQMSEPRALISPSVDDAVTAEAPPAIATKTADQDHQHAAWRIFEIPR